MLDLSAWMPWRLAAHAVAAAIPIAGVVFAIGAYNDMIARLRFDDPDNPMLAFVPSRMGTRRRRTELTWLYMSTYGADANSVAFIGGQILVVAGFFLFPQIDTVLTRVFTFIVAR
jgi:hypothetical protein